MIRRYKKRSVELTSLLDLLFVMIFLSLLQTKETSKSETKAPEVSNPAPKAAPRKVEVTKSEVKKTIAINAIFHFYGPQSNPGLPKGTYLMSGTFDQQSGALKLGGTSWVDRPSGYDMVPLNGKINQNTDRLTGRIEFQDCEQFVLVRKSRAGNGGIAGKWEGSYVCAQGETGLTLTIQ